MEWGFSARNNSGGESTIINKKRGVADGYVPFFDNIHRSVSWVTAKNLMGGCRVCGSLFDLLCTENPLIGSNTPSCFLGRSCFFRYICRCESLVCASFTLVVEDEEPTVV